MFWILVLYNTVLQSTLPTGGGGESDSLNQLDVNSCLKTIDKHKNIIGVKVRLTADVANDGKNEEEAFRFVVHVHV